jgi:hypothetical protein
MFCLRLGPNLRRERREERMTKWDGMKDGDWFHELEVKEGMEIGKKRREKAVRVE